MPSTENECLNPAFLAPNLFSFTIISSFPFLILLISSSTTLHSLKMKSKQRYVD